MANDRSDTQIDPTNVRCHGRRSGCCPLGEEGVSIDSLLVGEFPRSRGPGFGAPLMASVPRLGEAILHYPWLRA